MSPDPLTRLILRLRIVEAVRLTAEQRATIRATSPEKTFQTRAADYFECYGPAERCSAGELCRFEKGDRILYRNPCGMGGVLLAAKLVGFSIYNHCAAPMAVGLDVEPSEPLRAIAGWLREQSARWPQLSFPSPFRHEPNGIDGCGGRMIITGDEFSRAVQEGRFGLEAEDEAGRAVEARALAAVPYWWETRRAIDA